MLDKLELYYKYLIEENNKYNLTSITKKEDVFHKHFKDSLCIKDIVNLNEVDSLCDIGSGAGFPGLIIALYYPNIKVTIIEPTFKKVTFMKNVVSLLALNNVTFYCARAEEVCFDLEEMFDIVTARAVTNLSSLLELSARFCKVGGYIVSYKGDKGMDEVLSAQKAFEKLDCSLDKVYFYELENNYGKRSLIRIKKNKKTKAIYPRNYAEIKKKPL